MRPRWPWPALPLILRSQFPAGILIRVGLLAGVFSPPEFLRFAQVAHGAEGFPEAAAVIFSILFSLNLLLGVFNLLPVPPLDGWSALGLLLPESGARKLAELSQRFGMFSFIGLVVAWQFLGQLTRQSSDSPRAPSMAYLAEIRKTLDSVKSHISKESRRCR